MARERGARLLGVRLFAVMRRARSVGSVCQHHTRSSAKCEVQRSGEKVKVTQETAGATTELRLAVSIPLEDKPDSGAGLRRPCLRLQVNCCKA